MVLSSPFGTTKTNGSQQDISHAPAAWFNALRQVGPFCNPILHDGRLPLCHQLLCPHRPHHAVGHRAGNPLRGPHTHRQSFWSFGSGWSRAPFVPFAHACSFRVRLPWLCLVPVETRVEKRPVAPGERDRPTVVPPCSLFAPEGQGGGPGPLAPGDRRREIASAPRIDAKASGAGGVPLNPDCALGPGHLRVPNQCPSMCQNV